MYLFPSLEPVCCFISGYNCCFLTYITISEETGKVVCYSHRLKNFPQFVLIHKVKGFSIVSQFSRSVVSDSATPWTVARQAFLSITNSRSSLKPIPIAYCNNLSLSVNLYFLPCLLPFSNFPKFPQRPHLTSMPFYSLCCHQTGVPKI